jgi:hypothetical protein
MRKLIGICGLARHGKDTIASIIHELYFYQRIAFADAVREVALAINPLISYARGKNAYGMEIGIAYDLLSEYVRRLGGWDEAKKNPEVRRLLQRIGTEAGRNIFGENIWLDIVKKRIQDIDYPIITDVRFPNEIDYVLKNGILIKVVRPNFDNGIGTEHPSEKHVAEFDDADIEITNDGTLDDLKAKIRGLNEYLSRGIDICDTDLGTGTLLR